MNNGFGKGLIMGGIMGASLSAIVNKGMSRKRNMIKRGRSIMRGSNNVIRSIMDMFM